MTSAQEPITTVFTNRALEALVHGQSAELSDALQDAHPAAISKLIESAQPAQRIELLEQLPEADLGAVLDHLPREFRNHLFSSLNANQLARFAEYLDPAKLARTICTLPDLVCDSVIESLRPKDQSIVNAVLEYAEGTAGRIMTTDALSVRSTDTLGVVSRWLRDKSSLPAYTNALMVTDDEGKYLGKVLMGSVVTGDLDATVESVMLVNSEWIDVEATEHDIARLFEQRQLVEAAVLDKSMRVVGRITVERAMSILQREADQRLLGSGGISGEADLFAPVIASAKQRGVWLGLNLATVFLAAWVIGRFQVALDQIVALAVLMPIVASMGGIAGSQTLTLTIRGLALDQIVRSNVRWLATKEMGVGALNGIAWAVVVAIVTYLWFESPGLSLIIGTAMIVNLVVASISGVVVPLVLKRFGFDPALSGAVVLTTVTDIVGYLSFLGMASAFLL